VVSRQTLIDSRYSSVVCAAVYSNRAGLVTEIPIGIDEGLKHDSCIRCDELVNLRKNELTHYVGLLSRVKIGELNRALLVALDIPNEYYQL